MPYSNQDAGQSHLFRNLAIGAGVVGGIGTAAYLGRNHIKNAAYGLKNKVHRPKAGNFDGWPAAEPSHKLLQLPD